MIIEYLYIRDCLTTQRTLPRKLMYSLHKRTEAASWLIFKKMIFKMYFGLKKERKYKESKKWGW